MSVFKTVRAEQIHHREVQKYKYNFTYTVNALVNPSSTLPVFLTIEQDADFLIERITGSVYGPTDANAIPAAANTDFPMPGIAAGAGFAGRGITLQITDTGAGRTLTNGFVPAELLLTPGYGIQFHLPYPVKYFARRNSKIRFDFRNRDTQANARHNIDIALNGTKYQMPDEVMRGSGDNAVTQ